MTTINFSLWLFTWDHNNSNKLEEEENIFGEAIAGGDLSNNRAVENRWDTCSAQQLTKIVSHATATALTLGEGGGEVHSALSNNSKLKQQGEKVASASEQVAPASPLLTEI